MYSLIFAAVAGLAAAAPHPQDFDPAILDTIPSPTLLGPAVTASSDSVPYVTASIISSIEADVSATPLSVASSDDSQKKKRTAAPTCQPQPPGSGPVPNPDTPAAFLADPDFANTAETAAGAPPSGYNTVFSNLQGSTQQTGYIGLHTLTSYDVGKCAQYCDSSAFCEAFNIYFERDPTVNPNDPSCSNPPSTTNIKCTLYGYPISADSATNTGQYRNQFQVVIAGSNGYVKDWQPPALPGFTGPVELPTGCSINAPNDPTTGKNTFMGSKAFDTGRFDPSLCSAACQANTLYDKTNPAPGATTYDACNFFNAYISIKNNIPVGTVCAFYTEPWGSQYATNCGSQSRSDGVYTKAESFTYTLTVQDPGTL